MAEAHADDDFPVAWPVKVDQEPFSDGPAALGTRIVDAVDVCPRGTAPGAIGRDGRRRTTGGPSLTLSFELNVPNAG